MLVTNWGWLEAIIKIGYSAVALEKGRRNLQAYIDQEKGMSLKKSTVNFSELKQESQNIYSMRVDNRKIKFHTVDHIAEYLFRHDKSEPIDLFWNTNLFGRIYLLSIRLKNGQVLSVAKKESDIVGVFMYLMLLYSFFLFIPLFLGYFVYVAANEIEIGEHIFTVPLFSTIFISLLLILRPLKRMLDAKAAKGEAADIKSRGEEIFGH